MPALTPFIQHSFGSPSHSNRRRKREERHPNLKEKLKLLLFTDDMILHRESPEDTTKELLGLINELVAGYKIKTQKYVVLYILTMNYQKEKGEKIQLYQKK